ncbi:MAG: segregation and condensation protein A [Parasphingorhabdus sp.]|jgi:segregation and condensation protein A
MAAVDNTQPANSEPTPQPEQVAVPEGKDVAEVSERQAIVRGEVFEKWPQDLFIPPDALEVILESFQGPLDLLLYLIRKHNLDILDIPVAEITRQYMEYVEVMRRIRLDLAAEYLLMAAMLAEIKSRMLIHRESESLEDEEDPRAALVRRLQEYERFREAALELDERPREERDLFVAHARFEDFNPEKLEVEVDLDQLVQAYRNVMLTVDRQKHFVVERETLSLRERMTHILDKLNSKRYLRLSELFTATEGRMGLVVSFVAILELSKDNMLHITQNEPLAPIHIQSIE